MPSLAVPKHPSVDSTPPTRRHAVAALRMQKSAPRLSARTKLTRLVALCIHNRPPRAVAAAPRRATMAGDNTIGWQDKKDYRAKLTIARPPSGKSSARR